MKHKKGLFILLALVAVSVIFGAKSIFNKIHSKDSFSFSFSTSKNTGDSDEGFEEEFDDDDFEDFTGSSPLNKIISRKLGKKSTESVKNTKSPYISVIYITGVISEENKTYNQKWLLKKIKAAKNDSKNRGILLKIDSPGGTVYESDEAYLALMEYKSSTNRPVYAYFGSLAASGGYYIGCAADTIYANRNTLTGSIGVIAGQSVDATGLLEKLGVKMNTITAGRNKNMGNYNQPLTEEQRAIMQSIADEAYNQFTGIVADSRGMSIENVRELADGRIYTANQAKNNGLIDDVCSFEEAKDEIRSDKEESVNFVDYKYQYEENWMSLLYGASSFVKNPTSAIYEMLGNTSGKCLYLYN